MNLDKVINAKLDDIEHSITANDCMLYALGVGYGADPLDLQQLPFVYEEELKVAPSQSVVIAHPGAWVAKPEYGIDWLKILHGEQSITMVKPLVAETTYIGRYEILGVVDKGEDKGALLYQQKNLFEKNTGDIACKVTSSYFLRGDGGCGSTDYTPPETVRIPDRQPDRVVELPTALNSALIYRLSGDYNPLHADPRKAAKVGFDRPILHGLCTFGVATHAALKTYCDYDPSRLQHFAVRFSSPVFPGETIELSFYEDGDNIHFTATVKERNKKVLDQGLLRVC